MSVYQWSTTAGSNASADSNINWAEGQLPSTVNDSARAMMAALAALVRDQGGYATLGGSGNTFTLSLSQAMTSRVPSLIGFFATRSNTGAVTMNVDSLGAAPLRRVTGIDLVSGDIVSGAFYIISWDSTNSEWKLADQAGLLPLTGGTMTGLLTLSGAPTTGLHAATKTYVDTASPAGSIMAFAGTSAPTAWLSCDGSAVSRSTYATLFTAIGTTWGSGNGTTTFNVPDLRGTFLRGSGTNATGSSSGAVGPAVGTYAADTYLNHSHGVTDPGHTHTLPIYNTGQGTSAGGSTLYPGPPNNLTSLSNTTGITVDTSTTGGTETRPKNYGVLYIIKT